jgi:hypothetical protein
VESGEAPWLVFIHRVLSGGYDLVRVAKPNRTRRMDQQMGSVSMKLVRTWSFPVGVVNPIHEHDAELIHAATNLREVDNHGIGLAATLAALENRKLYGVHAWQIPFELQVRTSRMSQGQYQARTDTDSEQARSALRALPGLQALGVRAHIMWALCAPSSRILAVEHKIEPCLTAMRVVGLGGILDFHISNTEERQICKLESWLLIVRPNDVACPVSPRLSGNQ